jgi:hypothetical protein
MYVSYTFNEKWSIYIVKHNCIPYNYWSFNSISRHLSPINYYVFIAFYNILWLHSFFSITLQIFSKKKFRIFLIFTIYLFKKQFSQFGFFLLFIGVLRPDQQFWHLHYASVHLAPLCVIHLFSGRRCCLLVVFLL